MLKNSNDDIKNMNDDDEYNPEFESANYNDNESEDESSSCDNIDFDNMVTYVFNSIICLEYINENANSSIVDMDIDIYRNIMHHDFESLQKLIENGTDINLIDINGNTPLHMALMPKEYTPEQFKINQQIICYLIDNNADLSIKNNFKNTILILACDGYFKIETCYIIEKILDKIKENKLDIINYENGKGYNALDFLIFHKQPKLIKLFINNGAIISIKNLHHIMETRYLDLFTKEEIIYIIKNFDISLLNTIYNDYTLLALLCFINERCNFDIYHEYYIDNYKKYVQINNDIILILLKIGVNPNIFNIELRSPILLVCYDINLVDLLIDYNVNINEELFDILKISINTYYDFVDEDLKNKILYMLESSLIKSKTKSATKIL